MAQDDDDWVGTPPEGRHTSDRAKPDFWLQRQPIVTWVFFAIFVLALIALLLAVL
jgi:hypothetical protein